jgi:hypothetical protein
MDRLHLGDLPDAGRHGAPTFDAGRVAARWSDRSRKAGDLTRCGRTICIAVYGGHDVRHPPAFASFQASRLDWGERLREPHASIWRLYHDVIELLRSQLNGTSKAVVNVQAPDDDTLMVERVQEDGRVCLCVVRLRGRGGVEHMPTFGRCGGCERLWRIQCSTEDAAYACDPQPIAWRITGEGRQCAEFRRPGALIPFG